MFHPTTRRQGDPVQCGWSIGRAPLRLRGIRFVDGEQGGAPAAPPAGGQAPAGGENPPAPNPAQLAAFYAAQNGGQAPPAAPAPQAPAAPQVQQLQDFTPEQVKQLMGHANDAARDAAAAQEALAAMQQERDDAQAQLAQYQRESAVRTAAGTAANADLLLDSAKFQAAVKDVDLTDGAALTAAVAAFVKDNPAYAAAPTLPNTSGGTPAGSSTTKPNTLEGAIAARLGG
ncbi:hypothetical protein [Leucobacter sp.]